VRELVWNESNFEMNTEIYNSPINGTLNLEKFQGFPILASLQYFSGADFILQNQNSVVTIDHQQMQGDYLTNKIQKPTILVERFSGFTFSTNLPFMYSMVLKKSSPLIDKGMGYFYNLLVQDFYVPICIVTETFSYNDDGVS
jgi:hypothetical protein